MNAHYQAACSPLRHFHNSFQEPPHCMHHGWSFWGAPRQVGVIVSKKRHSLLHQPQSACLLALHKKKKNPWSTIWCRNCVKKQVTPWCWLSDAFRGRTPSLRAGGWLKVVHPWNASVTETACFFTRFQLHVFIAFLSSIFVSIHFAFVFNPHNKLQIIH